MVYTDTITIWIETCIMAKKKTENYVNNKDFLEAISVYRKKVLDAKEKDLPKPRVPNYIGDCFLKIATHLSYKPNFVNYMFRDEMISDGIENCLQYIHNFDPEKSSNPFAYFTQVIYFAFLRRIAKEKKQLEIKTKILERSGYEHVMYTESFEGDMAGLNQNYSDMSGIKENLEIKNKR
jgi:hypothetical protein